MNVKRNRFLNYFPFFAFIIINISYGYDLKDYKFSNSYRYAILEDTGVEKIENQYLLTTSYSHVALPFYIQNSATGHIYREIIKSYDLLSLGISYQYNEKVQLIVESSIVKAHVLNERETSFSDTFLKTKINFWKNTNQSFSLIPEIILPTGSELSFTTRSSVGGAIRGVYEHHFDKFHFVGSLGFDYGSKNTYVNLDNKKIVLAELGFSYDIYEEWNINLEKVSTLNFNRRDKQSFNEGDFYLTLKKQMTKNVSLFGGFGIAGDKENDRKNQTVFVGIKFGLEQIQIPNSLQSSDYAFREAIANVK
jgi:hypothetical protein